jgi:hypothetical protein
LTPFLLILEKVFLSQKAQTSKIRKYQFFQERLHAVERVTKMSYMEK